MKTIKQAVRTLLLFMLIFCNVGVYAQRKEVSYFNDSVEICPLADKELIDSCYYLLDRNMMLETEGVYGQIAILDAPTSEVLAWASLEKLLDGECEGCGDMVYVPFKKKVCSTDIFVPFIAARCLEESNTPLGRMVDTGCGIFEVNDSLKIRDHNWRRGGYGTVTFKKQVCFTDVFVPFIAAKCLEKSNTSLGKIVDTGCGILEINDSLKIRDHNWRRGGYGTVTFKKALLMKSRIGMYKAFTTMPNGTDLWRQACDTTAKSNAIELAMTFNQKYHPKSSLEYVKKIATGIFEKKGIQHRLAPEGVKLAGMYNIRQSDDNKRTSDEFTFVGCFPADNPKYTIGMVVIRPHKLPANIGMLSKEVNQLIEWLMNRNK